MFRMLSVGSKLCNYPRAGSSGFMRGGDDGCSISGRSDTGSWRPSWDLSICLGEMGSLRITSSRLNYFLAMEPRASGWGWG